MAPDRPSATDLLVRAEVTAQEGADAANLPEARFYLKDSIPAAVARIDTLAIMPSHPADSSGD